MATFQPQPMSAAQVADLVARTRSAMVAARARITAAGAKATKQRHPTTPSRVAARYMAATGVNAFAATRVLAEISERTVTDHSVRHAFRTLYPGQPLRGAR